MVSMSARCCKGGGYGFNNLVENRVIHQILTAVLDSSHCPNQLWSAGHVLNLNIKKSIDISVFILGG